MTVCCIYCTFSSYFIFQSHFQITDPCFSHHYHTTPCATEGVVQHQRSQKSVTKAEISSTTLLVNYLLSHNNLMIMTWSACSSSSLCVIIKASVPFEYKVSACLPATLIKSAVIPKWLEAATSQNLSESGICGFLYVTVHLYLTVTPQKNRNLSIAHTLLLVLYKHTRSDVDTPGENVRISVSLSYSL